MSDPHAASVSLDGLEADNLLAFLALLGLLRALETARPEWRPRVSWRGVRPTARLTISSGAWHGDQGALVNAIVAETSAGMKTIAPSYRFDRDDLKFTLEEFRGLASEARGDRDHAELVSALACEVVRKDDKGRYVAATPLCAMLGQGHQHFLRRLVDAVAAPDADELRRALFESWRYDDDSASFRWDPGEDRRHAYQFGDPSETKYQMGTVAGANSLAAIGVALLACVPTISGLGTRGVSPQEAVRDIVWPIVSAPAGLTGHIALLDHVALYDLDRSRDLAAYGVLAVARARRYQVDKFFNFERARMQFL